MSGTESDYEFNLEIAGKEPATPGPHAVTEIRKDSQKLVVFGAVRNKERLSAPALHAESPYVFAEWVLESRRRTSRRGPRLRSPFYFTCNSSISKIRVSFGPILGGAPRRP